MAPTPTADSQRGSATIAVLVLVLVLAALSVMTLHTGLAEAQAQRTREAADRALEIAEAGLVRAAMEIHGLTDADDDGIGVVAGGLGGGTFTAQAQQDPSNEARWEVEATGSFDRTVRRLRAGLRRRTDGYWAEVLYSGQQSVLNGSLTTDSFDSRLGTWASQAVNEDSAGVYANANGHVGSNQGIDLVGSAIYVRGNAIPGPGYTTEFSGQPGVGDSVPRTEDLLLAPPPIEDFLAAYGNPSNGNMLLRVDDGDGIDGDPTELTSPTNWRRYGYTPNTLALAPTAQTHVVLPGGTYFFTKIDLSGNARLEIMGPSRIYVTGTIDLTGGGLVNATGYASDCQIFAHPYSIPSGFNPSNASIRLTGGTQVAAAIYAPERDATIVGGGDLFGALVVRNLTVSGNTRLHYDEALSELDGVNAVFLERLYWRELALPPR